MLTTKRGQGQPDRHDPGALRRELAVSERIPYLAHLTESIVSTQQGDLVFAFRLAGVGFETVDDVTLNQWHERLNVVLRNVASPNLALWTHLVRRPHSEPATALPEGLFANQLARHYCERLAGQRLMVNELFLSVVYRPQGTIGQAWLARLLTRHDPKAAEQARIEALEECAKLQQQLAAAFAPYGPRLLQAVEDNGVLRSELVAFLGQLVNVDSAPMPLGRTSLAGMLATTRPFFGAETIELRTPTASRLAAVLGVKEYPTPSTPDMFHRLLTAPVSFVLTQSFTFIAKGAAQGLLQAQYNRMVNAGDLARSQTAELTDALDAVAGNRFVLGDHHFTMLVLSDPYGADDRRSGAERIRDLNDRVALARELLADTGMVVAREDLALEAGFWAQLPGNFAYRPRKAAITSRNFAAMVPWHNFPAGRARGNHWGEALALLTTRAASPYHFSLHASITASPSMGDEDSAAPDVGHTFVCGPTGTGKTVFLGFCISMLTRQGASQVVFDKDRGLEVLVRALGGVYLPLRQGEPTGFNPLQLPATPANLAFLREWLELLIARPDAPLTARQARELDEALRGVYELDPRSRRLSRVLEYLDPTDPEGLYPRLARWCSTASGELAWAFDGAVDQVVPMFDTATLVGIDVTEFLDAPAVRAPITMYLFHLVRQLLDGRRFVCWCDEFWKLLADPAFETFSRDGPKTWRKLNGVFAASTQSASDVLASPISRTLIEQTVTQVFFPNPQARPEDYIDGFGLTEREFRLVREELATGGRHFLVRQGRQSVVCTLDLTGFDAELAVISGRPAAVEYMRELIAMLGPHPEQWLPDFLRAAHLESKS